MHIFNKRTLAVFATSIATLFVYFGLFTRTAPAKQRLPMTRYPDTPQAYAQLKAEYDSVLVTNRIEPYKDSSQITKIGPPIRTLLNNNNKTSAIAGESRQKRILLWTRQYLWRVDWLEPHVCNGEINTCVVTTDKNDLLRSDAVVMYAVDIWYLPQQRLANQRWVYYTHEPPYLTWSNFVEYDGVFNWTMSYRLDADIPHLYLESAPLEKPLTDSEYRKVFSEIITNKKRLVAIAHSNCHPASERVEIVQQLELYIPVDSYGRCGELVCKEGSKDCDNLFSTYKFYLSFENSRCRDYVTEKALLPLYLWKAVPIVLGAREETYARLMPPGSYINVDGFRSVKKLAEFILFLDEHPEVYQKYHAWRKTHGQRNREWPFCMLCKALHNDSLPVKTYTDFKGWYDEEICVPGYALGYVITHTRLLYIIGLVSLMILVAVVYLLRCVCRRLVREVTLLYN